MRSVLADGRFGTRVYAGSPTSSVQSLGITVEGFTPVTLYVVLVTPAGTQRVNLLAPSERTVVMAGGRSIADTNFFGRGLAVSGMDIDAIVFTPSIPTVIAVTRQPTGTPIRVRTRAGQVVTVSGTLSATAFGRIAADSPQSGLYAEVWAGSAHPDEVQDAMMARLAAAHL